MGQIQPSMSRPQKVSSKLGWMFHERKSGYLQKLVGSRRGLVKATWCYLFNIFWFEIAQFEIKHSYYILFISHDMHKWYFQSSIPKKPRSNFQPLLRVEVVFQRKAQTKATSTKARSGTKARDIHKAYPKEKAESLIKRLRERNLWYFDPDFPNDEEDWKWMGATI